MLMGLNPLSPRYNSNELGYIAFVLATTAALTARSL
jgi:hypothetical protein